MDLLMDLQDAKRPKSNSHLFNIMEVGILSDMSKICISGKIFAFHRGAKYFLSAFVELG